MYPYSWPKTFRADILALSVLQLVTLALRALKEASADQISEKTCSVAVVGKDTPFRLLPSEDLTQILEGLIED